MRTPFGNDYTLEFVKAAIRGEDLGKNSSLLPDLLVLSLSTQDRINHLFGPESQQAQDHFLRLDRALADFLTFLDDWVGLSSSLILLTADHGFPDSPEHCQEGGLEAGRIDQPQTARELNASLEAQFGPGRYVISWPATNNTVYLDRSGILERNLTARQVENAAAQFLLMQPGVETVLTKTEIESGPLPDTVTARQVRRSWDPDRSGDLYVIQKPCWFLLGGAPYPNASTHGSPHGYDTHVPVLFLGRWLEPGEYRTPAAIVDIAPTLAHLLGINPPSGSEGRILREILR
jgi:arylsulfatase A-like enzyme